jgi:branched-chain amino acid transport system substrate-binding protein
MISSHNSYKKERRMCHRTRSEEITVGVSISLTGKFQMQGQDAFSGIRLWVEETNRRGGIYLGKSFPLRLVCYDDRSQIKQAVENVRRLLKQDHVDILFGPYSSGLTMAVAPVAEDVGKVLWNHGGSSDAIFKQGWRYIVSVLSPASHYLRDLPLLLRCNYSRLNRIAVLEAARGSFAAEVASGLERKARTEAFELFRIPFESLWGDATGITQKALATRPEVLVIVGSFQDEVQIVHSRDRFSPPVQVLAAVAAGVKIFYQEVGALGEGVIGPSQWEPQVAGPPAEGVDSHGFVSQFVRQFGMLPDYTAAQSFASGIVLLKCIEQAGSLADERLRRVAGELDSNTFYGRFRIDPLTGQQIGHQVLLTQWQGGAKRIAWPVAAEKPTTKNTKH